jgi:hypothetical protein
MCAALRPLCGYREGCCAPLLAEPLDIAPEAGAPEIVEPIEHRARQHRRDGDDDRAGFSKRLRPLRPPLTSHRRQDRSRRRASGRSSACGRRYRDPSSRNRSAAGWCRRASPGATAWPWQRPHPRRCGSSARRSARHSRDRRDAAVARLEAEDAGPAGGQAHRAADICADMQRSVAGGSGGRRAGAGAAGVLGQVPGIAAELDGSSKGRTRACRNPGTWSWQRSPRHLRACAAAGARLRRA